MSRVTRGGCHYPLGSPELLKDAGAGLCSTSKIAIDPGRLELPVREVRGVGRTTQERLAGLGIFSVRDLLLHLPFRHESPSRLLRICDLKVGEEATLQVQVVSCAVKETSRRRVKVLEALVSDETGSTIATWYNQAYLETALKEKPSVLLRGSVTPKRGGTTFVVKRHEIVSEGEQSRHVLGLIPVYPSTGDLSVRTIRTILHRAAPELRHMIDPMPAQILARKGYGGKREAIWASHFPTTMKEAKAARDRLAFEELLLLQLAVLEKRAAQEAARRARPVSSAATLSAKFVDDLAYKPTSAQQRAIGEIDKDLARDIPMRRLLHGDVGSGKTMVATYCLLKAIEEGAQGAMMAPTEVLADQHYLGLSRQLTDLGVRVSLIKGSQSSSERDGVLRALESGEVDVVVGTHALIQDGVRFADLRVVVVDEQHRFGVKQRDAIVSPDGEGCWPHTLHMSATPIPRTLSLTLYGDLDISVLDEMPPGRQPVKTKLVAGQEEADMWKFLKERLRSGRQAYVVCPLVEESERLQAASATQTFTELSTGELADFELRLLHGQLPSAEKASAMAAFAAGEAQVLVSTSVIEVGVDVGAAEVMVIMGARRFGLSQLHQLRGRVGRGQEQSYCFLMLDGEEGEALERLTLFARTSDGFELAEADLRYRGEGQIFGERQSGIGDLEVASLLRDRRLLEDARSLAGNIAAKISMHPSSPVYEALLASSDERFGQKIDWMDRV